MPFSCCFGADPYSLLVDDVSAHYLAARLPQAKLMERRKAALSQWEAKKAERANRSVRWKKCTQLHSDGGACK